MITVNNLSEALFEMDKRFGVQEKYSLKQCSRSEQRNYIRQAGGYTQASFEDYPPELIEILKERGDMNEQT